MVERVVEKSGPSYIVSENANWVEPLWKTGWNALKNWKNRTAAIPLLSGENDHLKRYMHPVFIETLFTVAQDMEAT